MNKAEQRRQRGVAQMVQAAREIKALRKRQADYVRELQKAAAEARRLGLPQRPPEPRAFNYEDAIEGLLRGLWLYEGHGP